MLKHLDKLLNRTTGLTAATALFSLMWLTLIDVVGRKFFNNSVPGGLELTEILMVIVIFSALPLVSWRDEHVVFDSLDAVIPDWIKGTQMRLVHLISALVFGFLARLMAMRAERFAEYGDTTVHLQLSIAPVAWIMTVLLAVTALVHFLFAIKPDLATKPAATSSGTPS
jgi:TRAP-type C4-dicarboxylate transport system permease small subunit